MTTNYSVQLLSTSNPQCQPGYIWLSEADFIAYINKFATIKSITEDKNVRIYLDSKGYSYTIKYVVNNTKIIF